MAAASMSMSVASTRFAAVVARAEGAQGRAASVVSMGVAASPAAMSCVFAEFPKARSGMNAAIVARAAEIFDLATEEAAEEGGEKSGAGEAEPEPAPAPAQAQAPPAVQQGSKLYVGNLPWTCDSAQLAEICQDFGTVEAVEVIYDQESGRSRGFAFVTMASNEDAQAVINGLDGADLGGRPLRVNYPQAKGDRPRYERTERSERPERRQGGMGQGRREDSPNKLFVGNLSWGCDEGALEQLFSDYGRVVDAKVVTDRDTGRSRGFGFVTLENESDARSAIDNLNGTDFDGRPLRVNLSSDKPPPRF